jgi:hypothetical protein
MEDIRLISIENKNPRSWLPLVMVSALDAPGIGESGGGRGSSWNLINASQNQCMYVCFLEGQCSNKSPNRDETRPTNEIEHGCIVLLN